MPLLLLVRRLALAACLAGLAACTVPKPGEAEIPDGARVTHRAVFIGESFHDTVGTISLYQSDVHPVIVFEPNFSFQGAPDTVVTLGSDGVRPETALGLLLRNVGRQAYAVPPPLKIAHFNEVWLWSRSANKPLGLARLTPL